MCGKIYGVHIPRKCIESMHFYSCPSPPLKTPGRVFWKSISPKTKGVEETMICFIKIQSENMKMTWNISLFIFCMICKFSKCDDFTVLRTISINSVVLTLLPLLSNHCNLTLKLHPKNSYLNEGWLFTGRFKVGRIPRMINKDVLAQFIYKPT